MVKVMDTDVLIIGGGAAGSCAAIEAARHGVTVLLITKGLLGRSGASVGASVLPIPYKNIREGLYKWMYGYSEFASNQKILRGCVESLPKTLSKLEEMGMCFRRNPDGSLLVQAYDSKTGKVSMAGSRSLYAPYRHGETGKAVMDTLRRYIQHLGIDIIEDTTATSLLKDGEKVVGATALDYVNGDFLAIKAKSTILATGAFGWLWKHSSHPRECTADGQAMAYRAGAELINIEFQAWHFANIAPPFTPKCMTRIRMPCMYMPPTGWYSHWYNSNDERFMQEQETGTKWGQALAVAKEIIRQKGYFDPYHRGYYASLKHVDKTLQQWDFQYDHRQKFGIDTTKDIIPCQFEAHTTAGGVRVNEKFETSLPSLYAAGGTYFPLISFAVYSGEVCAKHASEQAKKMGTPSLDRNRIRLEEERVLGFLNRINKEGFSPIQIKKKIREIMYEKVSFMKNDKALRKGLEELKDVRSNMLAKMRLRYDSKRYNYEWVDALDTLNMLDMSELIIHASLIRKESRAFFQRDDFPNTDNVNWLKNIIIRQVNGKMDTYPVPVELKYVKPNSK